MRIPIRQIRTEGNVAFVPLTKGYEAVIDVSDLPVVEKFNWYALKSENTVYAMMNLYQSGKRKTVFMHREICGTPSGMETDHIDGNGLNNRRANLRDSTHAQNMVNRKLNVNSTSGLKGAQKYKNRWQCNMKIGGKQKHLGFFDTPEEDHAAYCKAAAEFHGEFARLK